MLSDSVVLSALGQVALCYFSSRRKLVSRKRSSVRFPMSAYNLAGTTSSELGSLLTGLLKAENGNYDNHFVSHYMLVEWSTSSYLLSTYLMRVSMVSR